MDKRLFKTLSVTPETGLVIPSNIPNQTVTPRWVQYEAKQSFVNVFRTTDPVPAGIANGGFIWNWSNTTQGTLMTQHLGFGSDAPTPNMAFFALYCEPNVGVSTSDPIQIVKGGYSTFYQTPVELSESGGWIYFTIAPNHHVNQLPVTRAYISSDNRTKVLTVKYGYAIDLKNVNGNGEDFSGETINSLVNMFGGHEIVPGENFVAPEQSSTGVKVYRGGIEISSSIDSRTFSIEAGDALSVTNGECVFRAAVSDASPSYSLYNMAMVGDSQMAQDMYTSTNYISGKITPIVGVPKPIRAIGNLTGLNVEERSKGSTGFYSLWDTQQAYAFRAGLIKSNTDVIFFDLTANDYHKIGTMDACLDKNGERIDFTTFAKSWTNWGTADFEEYPLNETVSGTDWGNSTPTFAAYYNETFQKVWNKAPFAKIVIFEYGAGSHLAAGYNATASAKNRGLAIRLIQKWKKAGKDMDYWSCGHSTYAGKGYATDYVDNIASYRTGDYANPAGRNPYAHAEYGLNYYSFGAGEGGSSADTAVTTDNYATCDPFVVSYGCWPGPWHANKDWFEQYFNPLFATFIAHMCGFDDSTLPDALRLTNVEYQQKNSGWVDYGTDPSEWYQPVSDGLWFSTDKYPLDDAKETYSLTITANNCSISEVGDNIAEDETVDIIVTPAAGCTLPESIIVSGASYVWTQSTGELKIYDPVDDVAILISAVKKSPTIRRFWKTYSVESDPITIFSEAGGHDQTLSISNGDLSYIGDSVTVSINGTSCGANPQTLTVKSGDVVSATGGVCVFRVQTEHDFATDGSDIFYGLNWICVGDSLLSVQGSATQGNYSQGVKVWEMLSGQYATGREEYNSSALTNNMKRPHLYTGINCYNGKNTNGTWLAQGSTGYWKNTPFYQRLSDIPHDADIVTIYGSINDWTYRSDGNSGDEIFGAGSAARGKYLTETNMTDWYGSLTYAQNVTETDGVNSEELNTYAKYVYKAIDTAHRQAPLAKIVLVDPIFYNVSGSPLGSRNYIDTPAVRYIVFRDYKLKNNADWLSRVSWGLQPDATYDSTQNRWILDANSRATWLDDDSILVDGETLSAQKMISDSTFAQKYVYDYSTTAYASYGHMNTLYNELYFAPKFANLICDTLGINGYYLPSGLKCNNLVYESPEGEASYPITATLSHCAASASNPTTISANGAASLQFNANIGYSLPSTVTVSGATYNWNATTGTLTLSNPTSNVSISIIATKITYSIQTTLRGCFGSIGNATSIEYGGTVELTFIADSGYTLPETVIVSGATSSWDKTTGKLTLSNPTGVVSITITAVEESTSTGSNIPIYTANGAQILGLDALWTHSGTHPTHIYDKSCVEIIFQ